MESIRIFFETNYKLSIVIFLALVFLFLNLKRENKVGYIMMQFVILFFMYLCKISLNYILSGMLLINVSKIYWDRWSFKEEAKQKKEEGDKKRCWKQSLMLPSNVIKDK